jgi:hypothetical protein
MKIQPEPLSQDTGLGELVKKPEMPVPYRRIREGVYQGPDGKMFTEIQTPPQKPTIWDVLNKGVT